MKDYFIKSGYSIWLGFALAAFAHIFIDSWQFWAILVPTVILVVIKTTYEKEN
jgi:hypothetical protein